jgi:hypothetical protein
MSHFIITGVPRKKPAAADPPPRLEIRDFLRNEKFLSLYVQALRKHSNPSAYSCF